MDLGGGAAIAIIVWLIFALSCVFLWVGLAARGLVRMVRGTGGTWASAMAQISVLAMLIGFLRLGVLGIAAGLFPPALLVAIPPVPDVAGMEITGAIAVYALPATAITLALTVSFGALRPFSIVVTGTMALVTTLWAGEAVSSRAVCTSAAAQNLTNVTRNSFLWSISNAGRDYQFNLHAMATRDGDQFAWSYSEMEWYLLPTTIWANVQSGATACDH